MVRVRLDTHEGHDVNGWDSSNKDQVIRIGDWGYQSEPLTIYAERGICAYLACLFLSLIMIDRQNRTRARL